MSNVQRARMGEDQRLAEAIASLSADEIPHLSKELSRLYDLGPQGIRWQGGCEPCPFDEFCYLLDRQYMTERQADAWAVPRSIRASQMLDPQRTITEWLLIWGKRSGKDMHIAKLFAYVIYILHQLAEDPCTYMARTSGILLAPRTRLDVVNVAPNEDLARQVFFNYVKQYLASPIMQGIEMSPPPDKWKVGTNEIVFPQVNLHLYSKTSKSSGLDGFNLFMWVMDEADEFLDTVNVSNADVIHSIFRRTMTTTFGPFGFGMIISYPRYRTGFVMRMKERFEKSPDLFYVDVAPTHEVRPDFSLDSPVVAEEFMHDPSGASAMYLCEPMEAEDAFFEMPEKIDEAVDHDRAPVAEVAADFEIVRGDHHYVGGFVGSINRSAGHTYFLGGDGGEKSDSFALSVFHVDSTGEAFAWVCPRCANEPLIMQAAPYERAHPAARAPRGEEVRCGVCQMDLDEWNSWQSRNLIGWYKRVGGDSGFLTVNGENLKLPYIVEDLLVEFKPRRAFRQGEYNAPVDFISVGEVCTQLVNGLGIVQARFDPWATQHMRGILQSATNADVDEIKFGQPDQYRRARLAKALLYAGLIRLLPNEKRNREWKQLQRKNMKIDHPDGGSKDLYDSESIGIWLAATYANSRLDSIWL